MGRATERQRLRALHLQLLAPNADISDGKNP
jgi:hypothetical protein